MSFTICLLGFLPHLTTRRPQKARKQSSFYPFVMGHSCTFSRDSPPLQSTRSSACSLAQTNQSWCAAWKILTLDYWTEVLMWVNSSIMYFRWWQAPAGLTDKLVNITLGYFFFYTHSSVEVTGSCLHTIKDKVLCAGAHIKRGGQDQQCLWCSYFCLGKL